MSTGIRTQVYYPGNRMPILWYQLPPLITGSTKTFQYHRNGVNEVPDLLKSTHQNLSKMAHFISKLNLENLQTIEIDEKLHERLVRRSAKQNIGESFHFDKAQNCYQMPSLFQCSMYKGKLVQNEWTMHFFCSRRRMARMWWVRCSTHVCSEMRTTGWMGPLKFSSLG